MQEIFARNLVIVGMKLKSTHKDVSILSKVASACSKKP